jgi:hypothetical protein
VNPILMDGLFKLTKERPTNPVIWLANWLQEHNPYQPTICVSSDEVVEEINLVESRQDRNENSLLLRPPKSLAIYRTCKKCDFHDDKSLSCESVVSVVSSVTTSTED